MDENRRDLKGRKVQLESGSHMQDSWRSRTLDPVLEVKAMESTYVLFNLRKNGIPLLD